MRQPRASSHHDWPLHPQQGLQFIPLSLPHGRTAAEHPAGWALLTTGRRPIARPLRRDAALSKGPRLLTGSRRPMSGAYRCRSAEPFTLSVAALAMAVESWSDGSPYARSSSPCRRRLDASHLAPLPGCVRVPLPLSAHSRGCGASGPVSASPRNRVQHPVSAVPWPSAAERFEADRAGLHEWLSNQTLCGEGFPCPLSRLIRRPLRQGGSSGQKFCFYATVDGGPRRLAGSLRPRPWPWRSVETFLGGAQFISRSAGGGSAGTCLE